MDKNTVIGFLLIAVIIIGFGLLNRPSEEEIARQRKYNDSIALVQQTRAEAEAAAQAALSERDLTDENDSTIQNEHFSNALGEFGIAARGTDELITLENELIRLKISTKGGTVYSAELKNYKTHDSLPLILFEGDESRMNFTIITNKNRVINTADLYFEQISDIKKDESGNQSLILRLNTTEDAYLDFAYTLPADDYMLAFGLKSHNMTKILPVGTNYLEMQWNSKIRQQEKGRKFETRYSAIHYKYDSDDMEKMSESKNDAKKIPNRLKWIAFKDQFFSTILIANDAFTSTSLTSTIEKESSPYMKSYASEMITSFDPTGNIPTTFRIYYGPNQYKILKAYDNDLPKEEKLRLRDIIPLGWGIFGWVNKGLIIPMFNFFGRFISNYGIIILLMTIVIKLIIFPMTYKSYMSSAKMRVLKPEIDEINKRIPADKAAERQQATMQLYSQVGVSPMSGCLPMLLQMPILFAMFSFFPASIELRQQSFLWAQDLSSYDAIISWNANIPIISNFLGNHISLFCVLFTVTNIISTKLNMSSQPTNDQMPAMKWMMYLMPVMFFFMFNNYASGLSYYYFLSSLITIGQTYAIRATINEEKLHAQLMDAKKNKKKNPKKTGFMERLEKAQREQQKAMKNKK